MTVRVNGALARGGVHASVRGRPGWTGRSAARSSDRGAARLGAGEAAGVRGGQSQFQVGRILVVGRGEGSRRDARRRSASGAEWQLDGQCCRTSSQVSADAGRVPSCASVAEPEKLIDVADLPGGAGGRAWRWWRSGAVLPTEIVTESVPVAPRDIGHPEHGGVDTAGGIGVASAAARWSRRTRRRRQGPRRRSVGRPSGSVEPVPSNATVSGPAPWSGVAVATAVGGLVGAGVADAPDRSAVEVDVEQIPAWAVLEVDRICRAGGEACGPGPERVGRRHPSASPRCSRASSRQRTERRRSRPDRSSAPRRTRTRARRSRSFRSGSVSFGHDAAAVVVGVERRRHRRRAGA